MPRGVSLTAAAPIEIFGEFGLAILLVVQVEFRGDTACPARRADQACHDGAAAAQRRERQGGKAGPEQAKADAPAAQRAGGGSQEFALEACCLGAVAELAAQHIADRSARWRRRLERPGVVGPGETAAVIAAAPEEIV